MRRQEHRRERFKVRTVDIICSLLAKNRIKVLKFDGENGYNSLHIPSHPMMLYSVSSRLLHVKIEGETRTSPKATAPRLFSVTVFYLRLEERRRICRLVSSEENKKNSRGLT